MKRTKETQSALTPTGNEQVSPQSSRVKLWSGTMAEADEYDRTYWLRVTPRQRMEALEYIRALNYAYATEDQPRPQFQRLYRVALIRKIDKGFRQPCSNLVSLPNQSNQTHSPNREKFTCSVCGHCALIF